MAERGETSRLKAVRGSKRAKRLPRIDLVALETDAGEAPPPPARRRRGAGWSVGLLLGAVGLSAAAVVNAHPWPAPEQAAAGATPLATGAAPGDRAPDSRDVRGVDPAPAVEVTLGARGFEVPVRLAEGRHLEVRSELRGYTRVVLMPGPDDPAWRDPQPVMTAEPGDVLILVGEGASETVSPRPGEVVRVGAGVGGLVLDRGD